MLMVGRQPASSSFQLTLDNGALIPRVFQSSDNEFVYSVRLSSHQCSSAKCKLAQKLSVSDDVSIQRKNMFAIE